MKSRSLRSQAQWLSMASPEQIELVDSIYELCERNYDRGGDVIVECWSAGEIVEEFGSVEDVKRFCGLKVEQELNARWGGDDDPQLKRAGDWD